LQDRNAHFRFRRLDLNRQSPVETGYQTILQTGNVFRIGVTADDNLFLCLTQRVEDVEKLFLRSVLAVEELNVVEQQHVQ
jgi:hypothetical protein